MMLNSIVKLVFEMNVSDYLSLSFSFSLSSSHSTFLSQSSYSIWVSFVGVQSFRPFHIAEQTK